MFPPILAIRKNGKTNNFFNERKVILQPLYLDDYGKEKDSGKTNSGRKKQFSVFLQNNFKKYKIVEMEIVE